MSCVFVHIGVNAILSVYATKITENSATLMSEVPCFSSNLECVLSHFTLNNVDVNVTNSTSDITGSLMTYSYPTQTITLSKLNNDILYNYCIVAINITSMMEVGEPVCGSFTTQKIITETNEGNHILYIGTLLLQYTYIHTYTHVHTCTYIFHMVTCTCKFNIAWIAMHLSQCYIRSYTYVAIDNSYSIVHVLLHTYNTPYTYRCIHV